ncbi:uncharacterized protein LOC129953922 [Eupeodes corollae]|uniref:uncharacterized protein LOC129953922 n=1 Tax=Eupeodes corollae TaxID=290404 RepID=UPI0024918AAB|nr:uncharacterized protein LOC129953922 [Eupeodes corollae]
MTLIRPIILYPVYILGFLSIVVLGRRSFDVAFESISCTTNVKYANISTTSCYVDDSQKPPKGYVSIEMSKVVTNLNMSIDLIALKSNTEHFKVFSEKNVDGCMFMENKIETTMLKIVYEITTTGGKYPKCPITKDNHIDLKGITIDAEKFPPYLPEAKYSMSLKTYIGPEILFRIDVITKVIQKKNHKQRIFY